MNEDKKNSPSKTSPVDSKKSAAASKKSPAAKKTSTTTKKNSAENKKNSPQKKSAPAAKKISVAPEKKIVAEIPAAEKIFPDAEKIPEVEEENISPPEKKSGDKYRQIQLIKIFVFAIILGVMSVIGLMMSLRPTVSMSEKRELAKFPDFTVEGLWDGSYFKAIDVWYSDTYPLRETMILASQKLQSFYGERSEQIIQTEKNSPSQEEKVSEEKKSEPEEQLPDGTIRNIGEMRGDIYITNNTGYELYGFLEDVNLEFCQTMNNIYSRFKDSVNFYVMLVPTSAGVMLDKNVLEDMGVSDQAEAIAFDYSHLDSGIRKVNVVDILRKHNAEYIYFHTDHHWTALGAYYAYTAFCKEKGIEPHDIKTFESVSYPGFLGSLYTAGNRSPELAANPDTVIAYYPKGARKMTFYDDYYNPYEGDIIADASEYDPGAKYSAFVMGDQPFSFAHNETIHDGSAVVVIKDSMGNAFVPWLIDHYEYVYWLDARYTRETLSQMVLDYNVRDVIFEVGVYGASNPAMHRYYDQVGW